MHAEELKVYIKDRVRITKSGCWVWTRARTKDAYGACKVAGKAVSTHRLAYMLWVGEIPRGWVVRHKCNNPPCCNPEHLCTGTHEDNTLDIILRKATRSTLTAEQRDRARAMRLEGKPVNVIADAIGSSFYVVRAAVADLPGLHPGRPRGSKNMHVRITDEMKEAMRVAYAKGGVTQTALAEKYGCSQDYVSLIVRARR